MITQQEIDANRKRYGIGTSGINIPPKEERKSMYETFQQRGGDISAGFVKGAIEGTFTTARALQGGGQRILAAIDPTKNLEQTIKETGFDALQGDKAKGIDEILKSQNTDEKIGKVAEFIAELVWPIGKAKEVQTLAGKGKELIKMGLDEGGEKGKKILDAGLEKGKELSENTMKKVGEITGITSKISKQNVSPHARSAFNRAEGLTPEIQKKVVEQRAKDYSDYYEMASKHVDDGMFDPPTGKIGSELGDEFERVIQKRREIGKIMGDEIKRVGDTKLDITEPFTSLETKLKDEAGLVVEGKGLKSLSGQSKMTKEEISQLNQYIEDINKLGPNPTAAELDSFMSRVPKEIDAYKAKNNVTKVTHAESIIMSSLSDLRNALTKNPNLKDYAEARSEYARLSNFIEEGVGFLGKKTQSGDYSKDASILKSSVQSILNGGKKDWLLQLEKETGYPAFDKATIALQAMKDAGDFKGLSLLETFIKTEGGKLDLPLSGKDVVGRTVDFLTRKGSDAISGTPKERTERFIKDLIEEINKRGGLSD